MGKPSKMLGSKHAISSPFPKPPSRMPATHPPPQPPAATSALASISFFLASASRHLHKHGEASCLTTRIQRLLVLVANLLDYAAWSVLDVATYVNLRQRCLRSGIDLVQLNGCRAARSPIRDGSTVAVLIWLFCCRLCASLSLSTLSTTNSMKLGPFHRTRSRLPSSLPATTRHQSCR